MTFPRESLQGPKLHSQLHAMKEGAMLDNLILGQNLSKVYGTATGPLVALDDVSFSIKEGEFISLVGPSGCGKSTLLSILGGLEDKTEGSLVVGGKHHNAPRPDIGMMFQTSVLFPWRSIRQNVQLPGIILGLNQKQQAARTEELLDMVGLNGFGDRYPDERLIPLSPAARYTVLHKAA
jgi:NitT/TauT family transport system ATP-binding protein